MSPLEFLQRLAALVPRPRLHLIRFHAVLAPKPGPGRGLLVNLALAPTVQIAHTGLMDSPGHRPNILHKDFGHGGIGIMDGEIRGLIAQVRARILTRLDG